MNRILHGLQYLCLCVINISLHLNYCRAYESGATQTARRLDGVKIRRRPTRQSIERRPPTPDSISGTDYFDVTLTLNENENEKAGVLEAEGHVGRAKEWREMRDLARSVFHVYFTNNDCDDDDIAQLKQSDSSKKPQVCLRRLMGRCHGFLNLLMDQMPRML